MTSLQLFGRCQSEIQPNASQGYSVGTVTCPKNSDPQPFNSSLHKLFNSITSTRSVNVTLTKAKQKPADPVIGEFDRPRLCILPGLILFLSLFAVAMFIKFGYKKGKEDISFKQWIFAVRQTGETEEDNPFFSDRKKIGSWNLGLVTESTAPWTGLISVPVIFLRAYIYRLNKFGFRFSSWNLLSFLSLVGSQK